MLSGVEAPLSKLPRRSCCRIETPIIKLARVMLSGVEAPFNKLPLGHAETLFQKNPAAEAPRTDLNINQAEMDVTLRDSG